MKQQTAELIITSRLLILQTKRLMLNSAIRRLGDLDIDSLRRRVEDLRTETERAQHVYRSAILRIGSPEQHEYWLVAYSRLIEMGNGLAKKLRDAAADLPLSERYQVSTDVEMIESIVANWMEAMRTAMARAAA